MHGARVLLAEDDFLIAMTLEDDLREAGQEVVDMVATAEAAVERALALRPDFIIMDIRLAGTRDGVDAALEIYRETGIRCLFASAHADSQSRARAEGAVPLGWLQKPYGRENLINAVHRACEELSAHGK
jgi:two-component system, response regulator PdtaR